MKRYTQMHSKVYSVSKKKNWFDSKFLKLEKKDTTKLIPVHDSIIILLSFGTLFIHIRPRMATQQYIL